MKWFSLVFFLALEFVKRKFLLSMTQLGDSISYNYSELLDERKFSSD